MQEHLWYKNAIIYSLDLKTFMDGNGDGTGDFEGLCARLDYLHAMGVDTIWLAPFHPSPHKDNGYDVSDYYGIDPRYGTAGQFVNFIHKANQLGLRVIMDLVVNHTSDQHPWFEEARSSKDNKMRDWYIWADKRPQNYKDGIVFPGFQDATWSYDKVSRSYYFHRFYEHQPDLNTDNPDVREEILRIMGYWLQMGVSGFRMDAVPFIIESPTQRSGKPKMCYEYLKEIRRFLQWRKGDALLLGEANVLPKETKRYMGEEGEGLHMMFNFFVNQNMFYALASGDTEPLKKALVETKDIFPSNQWAHFLRNHDELDLGRLTEKQRQIVFDRFGADKSMQLYGRGIRRRLAPMLGTRYQLELAYSFIFSLPGTPVIRYGDEIGMGDDLALPERDAVRTPMQWSDEFQAGFTTARKAPLPLINEGVFSYTHINVEQQRRDKDSMLNWTTALIRMRKECPEIGLGEWELLDTGFAEVVGIKYTWKDHCLFIWHNFADKPRELVITAKRACTERLIDLIDNIDSISDKRGRHTITMKAYGYRWFRAGSQ